MGWYRRHRTLFWSLTAAGVPLAYIGLWLDVPVLLFLGIVIALPWFAIVLPLATLLVIGSIVLPPLVDIYRLFCPKRDSASQGDAGR